MKERDAEELKEAAGALVEYLRKKTNANDYGYSHRRRCRDFKYRNSCTV